jgi:hypothetical protein
MTSGSLSLPLVAEALLEEALVELGLTTGSDAFPLLLDGGLVVLVPLF